MAVKKPKDNFSNGKFTWEEIFDTQDALDNGILGSVTAGTISQKSSDEKFLGMNINAADGYAAKAYDANSSDFGSMVSIGGQSGADGILSYKKRRSDQIKTRNQGVGTSQSILGGSVI